MHALLDLRASDGYAEVAPLRHPDILDAIGDGTDVLRNSMRFSPSSAGHADDLHERAADLDINRRVPQHAVTLVRAWREHLTQGDLAAGLRAVLQQIYKPRLPIQPTGDTAFQQAVTIFDIACAN